MVRKAWLGLTCKSDGCSRCLWMLNEMPLGRWLLRAWIIAIVMYSIWDLLLENCHLSVASADLMLSLLQSIWFVLCFGCSFTARRVFKRPLCFHITVYSLAWVMFLCQHINFSLPVMCVLLVFLFLWVLFLVSFKICNIFLFPASCLVWLAIFILALLYNYIINLLLLPPHL